MKTIIVVAAVSAVLGALEVLALGNLHHTKNVTVVQGSPIVAASSSAQDLPGLIAKVRPEVVKVDAISDRAGGANEGSGVVLDKQGDIVTNYHVINGADQLDVTLSDGTAASARVVGTDAGDDLALLRVSIAPDKLQPAELADTASVQPGELVFAIGNPFGLEGTVTQGIVSGISRTLNSGNGRPLRQLIQTNAAINEGNSGGGLFDRAGKLVGIASAVQNPTGASSFIGISYAVPVSIVQKYLPDLLAGRDVTHARLGISLQDVTPALAQSKSLTVQTGVLVGQVDPTSGAAKAGLRGASGSGGIGDVIVAIDGNEVKRYDDLANYLDTKKPGDKVELKIVRADKQMSLAVTLDAWSQG